MIPVVLALVLCACFTPSSAQADQPEYPGPIYVGEVHYSKVYYYGSWQAGANQNTEANPTSTIPSIGRSHGRTTTTLRSVTIGNAQFDRKDTPQRLCHRAYTANFTCDICETISLNQKLTTRNCTRNVVPRDRRYRGPGVNYAEDPEFAQRPWPAGEPSLVQPSTEPEQQDDHQRKTFRENIPGPADKNGENVVRDLNLQGASRPTTGEPFRKPTTPGRLASSSHNQRDDSRNRFKTRHPHGDRNLERQPSVADLPVATDILNVETSTRRVKVFTHAHERVETSPSGVGYRDIAEDRPNYAKDPAYQKVPWPASSMNHPETTKEPFHVNYHSTLNPFAQAAERD